MNRRDPILAAQARAEAREAVHSAHVQWYLAKVGGYPPRKRDRAVDAVARAKRRLNKASAQVRAVSSLELACTGHVFVTFDTVDAAQACIGALSNEKRYFRGAGPLQASMAPEPSDLIWENLQYTTAQRYSRIFLTTILIVVLTICNCTAINVTSVWQSETLKAFSNERGEDRPSVFQLLGSIALALLVMVTGYVSTIVTVPLLSMKLERWHQFANREVIIALRLAVFQVLIPSSSATVFVILNAYSMAGDWYATGGSLVVNSLLADMVIVNMGIDFIRPDVLLFRNLLAPRAKTQRQVRSPAFLPPAPSFSDLLRPSLR